MVVTDGPANFQRLPRRRRASAASVRKSVSTSSSKTESLPWLRGTLMLTPISRHLASVSVWAAPGAKSVMPSRESGSRILSNGVDDFVVVLIGKGRLKPQSPFERDQGIVVTVW